MFAPDLFSRFKNQAAALALTVMLCACGGGVTEDALQADTAEESASDLITFFEKAEPELKKMAKAASDAVEQKKFPIALQYVNQLKAQGPKLSADQFMVVTEAGVNIQSAIIDAAEAVSRASKMLRVKQETRT